MQILIAPNAFKNSLSATQVAEALHQGLQQSRLRCTIERFPIADGGDGTGELILKKCDGKIIPALTEDPLGRTIETSFGLIDNGKTAVIEMANASGLRLLKQNELAPMQTSSYGTGQLMKRALDEGVDKIILAMGGSATVDGGCGMLNALGIAFIGEHGEELTANPENLSGMISIDASGLDERIAGCEIVVICDVDNRLLGEKGAAAVFGPQKGATTENVVQLENFLTRFTEITRKQINIDLSQLKYGGAAGGATAGIAAWLNAKLVNGIEYFLELTGFEASVQKADMVITGEGSIDEQTLQGKGPFGVAALAKKHGLPVIGVAGKVPLKNSAALNQYFDALFAIGNEPADLTTALQSTEENLIRLGIAIGNMLAM